MASLTTCPRCEAALAIPISSRGEYCGAELSAATPPALKSASILPPELARLKRPKISLVVSMGGLSILLFAVP